MGGGDPMAMTRPRFAIVTAGDANGRRLTHVLAALGIDYALFTVAHAAPKRRGKRSRLRFLRERVRAHVAANATLRRLRQRSRPPFASEPRYLGFCNGRKMKAALSQEAPDYILMMGGGIIDAETIRLARIGVLNVHPGLLPWIRGVDVLRHAASRGVPMGVTAHFIDVGIDTGDVIEQVLLSVQPGDDHAALAERADEVSVAFMARLAKRLWEGETLPRRQQVEKHPLCRLMSADEAAAADALIREGEAMRRFEAGRLDLQLPDDRALMDFYDAAWPPAERF